MTGNAQAWHIVDWNDLYEQRTGGRSGKGQSVPWYIFGPAGDNVRYMESALAIEAEFGPDRWIEAFGLFGKLLEIAARQPKGHRGYILGKGGVEMSMQMLQKVTCFSVGQIERGLAALSHAGCCWIERMDVPAVEVVPAKGQRGGRRKSPQSDKQPSQGDPF